MQKNYNETIQEGIAYLIQQQLPDGSFESFSSKDICNFSDAKIYHTNFITAVILETLSYLSETPQLQKIKKKSAGFLLSQKSENWSWNYWSKNARESKLMPYPNDLDDTFCALNALYKYDKTIFTGATFASIVKLLTFAEIKEGGPYKTWLIPKNTVGWDDVDIVVNSNIAYFLSLQDISLTNIDSLFKNKLQKKDLDSPYYPSFYPFLYFISRFYTDKKNIGKILIADKNNDDFWENPLNTAMAIIALLNCDYSPKKLEKSIAYLIKMKQKNHWEAYAFCTDPSINKEKYYAGSPALTTTFSIVALLKYQQKLTEITDLKKSKRDKRNMYLQKIFSDKDFQLSTKELIEKGRKVTEKIIVKDTTQQIPLMPYYFVNALTIKTQKIHDNDIILLGKANMFGWLAYTIYDDFLDGEGDPQLLPVANIYLRRLTQIFDTAFTTNKNIASFFHTILDRIESANAWEVTHCRLVVNKRFINLKETKFPDYGNLEQLAYKSLGHGLGPLTILLLLEYKEESKEFVSIYNFFIHYLIAKQLHDDAHDWEEDLSKGHITFVVQLILKKALEKKIITKKEIVLKTIIPKLQKLFWYDIIEEVCLHINNHVEKAREELRSSSIILNKNILEDLLKIYKNGADKALEERKKTADFLQVYT